MFDDRKNKNNIPEEDDFVEQLRGLGEGISAPRKLKESAKSGIPLRRGGGYGASVHVKRFTRAALAYAVCVAVLVGSVLVIPQLLNNGDPTGLPPVGAPHTTPFISGGMASSDTTTTMTPPQSMPPHTTTTTELGSLPLTPPPFENGNPDRDLATLLAGKINLNEAGKVDQNSLRTEGFVAWGEDEDIPGLFDTCDNESEVTQENKGSCGGVMSEDGSYFYFSLTERETIQAYVITNAGNNGIYTGRTPVSWKLYATNDDTLPLEEWTVLDDVFDGELLEANWYAGGYSIDSDRQGAYQHYCWHITYTRMIGTVNVAEFALYAG